jgi:hypothetical protein
MIINHPSVKTIWFQNVLESAKWNRQVVVETSLALDASHRKYDATEVATLEQVVEAFMKANSSLFDTAIVRPWRPNF